MCFEMYSLTGQFNRYMILKPCNFFIILVYMIYSFCLKNFSWEGFQQVYVTKVLYLISLINLVTNMKCKQSCFVIIRIYPDICYVHTQQYFERTVIAICINDTNIYFNTEQ